MNSRVMILLAILLILGASVAGYLGYKTTTEAKQAAIQAEQKAIAAQKVAEIGVPGKVAVVVIKQGVPAYKVLAADDLAIDYLKIAPPRTYRTIAEVVGQTIQVELSAGALLELGNLQPGSEVARLLKPGERAVAIPVDEVVGGGGFVQPGDTVDILLFLRGENGARDSAQVVMQSLRVLGFGADIINPAGGTETPEQKAGRKSERARARSAVLAVAEKDVTRIMLASSLGTLRMATRPAAETQIVAPVAVPTAGTNQPAVSAAVACKPAAPSINVPSAAQRQLLTSSALQAAGTAGAAGTARSAPSRPAKPSAPAKPKPTEPTIMIYRGLDPQRVTP
ncbi:MAG: Flp pilus assembly protein CpaB [Pseudomonadota bacterium]